MNIFKNIYFILFFSSYCPLHFLSYCPLQIWTSKNFNKDVSKTVTASSLRFGQLIEDGVSITWGKRWYDHPIRQVNGFINTISS